MEMLDVREHDPEDFEGKCVRIGGVLYALGPAVGSGQSKIVHVLRNHVSGLQLSVLAIYRDPLSAPSSLVREQAARALDDLLGWDLVPDTMKVALPGCVAHLQDHVGPYEEPQHPDVAEGDRLGTRSRWKRALGAYSRALADRPSHTVALNNRAHVLDRLGRTAEAADDMARAVRIEPNYRPYLRAWVGYAAAAHRPTGVWDGCHMMKEKFPYDDRVGALLDTVPHMARLLSNEAAELADAGKGERAMALAHEAADTYDRLVAHDAAKHEAEQAVILANFGRCAARAGHLKTAVRPLFRAMALANQRQDNELFRAALREFRQAAARAPDEVAAEYRRLYGDALPALLRPDGGG